MAALASASCLERTSTTESWPLALAVDEAVFRVCRFVAGRAGARRPRPLGSELLEVETLPSPALDLLAPDFFDLGPLDPPSGSAIPFLA